MQAALDTPRSYRSRISELVDLQTALFNADAPEAERVVIHKQIVELQREKRKSEI
jgi:hypothetical protein